MKNTKGLRAALPFLIPSLIGFLVFSILPMVVSVFISVTSWDGLSELTLFSDFGGFMGTFYSGLDNYRRIFTSSEFYQVLGNTLKFVVLYIPAILVVSLGVACVLNSKIKGVGVLRVIYYIPVITSWVAGALVWRWVFSPEYGIINDFLRMIGIQGPAWLQSADWAMPSIVIASVWKDMGYFGLMFLSGLQAIDRQYYEAARIDGASKIKEFFKITLPLLSPTLFFIMIISLITSFQIFPQVMVMTPDGGPGGSTMVMMERVYKYAFRYYDMGFAAAYSWVLFAIILVCTAIQMKLQERWVYYDS